MKKVLLFLVIVGISSAAFCQRTEKRNVSGFTGINASSIFKVTVSKGNTESLTITADEKIFDDVCSEVRDGVLHLYVGGDKKINKTNGVKVLEASVVMKDLNQVKLSGACKLSSKDTFTPEAFEASCSGASDLDLILKTAKLTIRASGSCDVVLKAEGVKDAKLELSGSSDMEVDLKAENVQVSASGSSNIDLTGSAETIHIGSSGASDIKAVDFSVGKASIRSSGSCKVELSVTEALNVSSSGASTINYKGSPSIETNISGSSKIRKIQ